MIRKKAGREILKSNYFMNDIQRETGDKNGLLELAENVEAETVLEYVEHLGIKRKEDLQNKRILDVGAGARFFAGFCLRHGITDNIYNLDFNNVQPDLTRPLEKRDDLYDYYEVPETRTPFYLYNQAQITRVLWDDTTRRKLNDHTITGNWERIPFKDKSFDLVLLCYPNLGEDEVTKLRDSEGLVKSERLILEDKIRTRLDDTFNELIRVLNIGGELRFYPFGENYSREFPHRINSPTEQDKRVSFMVDDFLRKKFDQIEATGDYQVIYEESDSVYEDDKGLLHQISEGRKRVSIRKIR